MLYMYVLVGVVAYMDCVLGSGAAFHLIKNDQLMYFLTLTPHWNIFEKKNFYELCLILLTHITNYAVTVMVYC